MFRETSFWLLSRSPSIKEVRNAQVLKKIFFSKRSKQWGNICFLVYTPFWLTLCRGTLFPDKLYKILLLSSLFSLPVCIHFFINLSQVLVFEMACSIYKISGVFRIWVVFILGVLCIWVVFILNSRKYGETRIGSNSRKSLLWKKKILASYKSHRGTTAFNNRQLYSPMEW